MTNFNASSTETRTSASTYFTFDHFDKKIVGSELNFKKSGIPGSAQYNALMAAMSAHPNYTLSSIAPKVKKQTYEGLSFDLMMDYVECKGSEIQKAEFEEIVNSNAAYPTIKSWFVENFKAGFTVEKAKREIAQAQLRARKATARTAVRVRTAKAASAAVVEMPAASNF